MRLTISIVPKNLFVKNELRYPLFIIFAAACFLLLPFQLTAQQNQIHFQEADITPLQVLASSVDWGDFNGDGNQDLVITGRINPDRKEMFIYQNTGNGSFSQLEVDLEGVSEGDVGWADFDGDGDLDLAAIGWNSLEQPTATIYENENNQAFTELGTNLSGVSYGSLAWGDYDGDGDPDLLVTGATGDLRPTTTLYENNGNGEFSPVDANLIGVWKGDSQWGDFDNDGNPDLVLTGKDREGFPIDVIYKNDGNGSFSQLEANLMGVFGGSSADWGDFDADKDLDLLITGWNANVQPATVVYENKNNSSFESVDARLMGVNDGSAKWYDFNNDNLLDIIVTGSNAKNEAVTRLYRNEPDTSFVLSNIPIKGTWRSSISLGDYDNDGKTDFAITGADFYNERITIIYRNQYGVTQSK